MNCPEPRDASAGGVTRRDFLRSSSVASMMALMGGVELNAQSSAEPKSGEAEVAKPKVKCGLIGLGAWGREILSQLGRLPQAEVAALSDHYPVMLRRGAGLAPGAAQHEDYRALLNDKAITAVIVATPTHLHKDIVLAALKAGKHVYCEAPLAHTIEDARSIALAAKDAPGQVFQSGLQLRSDPQRHFLFPFIRSGALGKPVQGRAQWHKKQSWRVASPNPEREKSANWRLERQTSLGLAGEIGIHQLEQAGWFWNLTPTAVSGFGANTFWKDGRDVPDTIQLLVEYPGGVSLHYGATLANSFDSDYEILYGSDAAVLMRDGKAWMFKEVDSPLLGWEVYARRDDFYKETGIALVAGGSKQTSLADKAADGGAVVFPAIYHALTSFLGNCAEIGNAVEDFKASFDPGDKRALREYLTSITLRPAADYREGFAATVLGIKANEAVSKGARIELSREIFELT